MNSTQLQEFEQKYEEFVRIWARYFFNYKPQIILMIEILIHNKKAILQKDYFQKDQIINSSEESQTSSREQKRKILDELHATYILNKLHYNNPDPELQQLEDQKLLQKIPLKQTQKHKLEDGKTVWGFDLDNIAMFGEYISQIKQRCEESKIKNKSNIQKSESSDKIDQQQQNKQYIFELKEQNAKIENFLDHSLKNLEEKYQELLKDSKLIDIKKSQYHVERFNKNLLEEKDNSIQFQAYGNDFKKARYAKLFQFLTSQEKQQ